MLPDVDVIRVSSRRIKTEKHLKTFVNRGFGNEYLHNHPNDGGFSSLHAI